MKFAGTFQKALTDGKGNYELTLCTSNKSAVEKLKAFAQNQKLEIAVKKFTNPRSTEANRYFWELISKMVPILRNDGESIYIELLRSYGTFEVLPFWEPKADEAKNRYRIVEEAQRSTLIDKNGKEQTFVWLKCYKGSSEYDRAEMARLIDGTVQEAQSLGIETRTPDEIAKIEALWGGEKS